MFSLTRTQFPDLLLGGDDLNDIAALWRFWHDQSRSQSLRPLTSYHAVRLRLWGCPQPDVAEFVRTLEARMQAQQFDGTVVLDDTDYLTVAAPLGEITEPAALAPWLALLNDRAFDGMVAFIEYTIRDWAGPAEGPAAAGGTLVVCGVLEPRGFRLKACWPVGLEPGIENLYKLTVWTDEEIFLGCLELFRQGELPPPPRDYFASRPTQRRATLLASLFIHVPGEGSYRTGRLGSTIFRIAFHTSVAAFLIAIGCVVPDVRVRGFLFGLLAFPVGALGYVVYRELARIWSLYWRMHTALKRAYSESIRFESVEPDDYGLNTDANARKYTRELETLGCRHLADVRHLPVGSGTIVNRMFVLPDERIYVFLNLMTATGKFKKYPAHGFYMIVTYLTDGRITTFNEGGGYRRSLNANAFARRYPEVDDPAILLDKHRKFVAEICARGHELAPPADLPELLERVRQTHDENRPLMERYGYYSWGAAFRQSYELVRREYLAALIGYT